MRISSIITVNNKRIDFGISVFIRLNQSYRDCLDRYRYFTDAIGRNFSFQIRMPFTIKKNKKS
jgi:hypothetical protein